MKGRIRPHGLYKESVELGGQVDCLYDVGPLAEDIVAGDKGEKVRGDVRGDGARWERVKVSIKTTIKCGV